MTILVLLAIVLLVAFGSYQLSKRRDWVDKNNQFAPFTWEIEGLEKPTRVKSDIPSERLFEGQDPMGMPIKTIIGPNVMLADLDQNNQEIKK
ncbi:hypothetical protein [Enterococcus bulliens]